MDQVRSIHDVPIRLTEERWQHITTSHPEMAEYYHDILKTVDSPKQVFKGENGTIVALRKIESNHHIVVIYKEVSSDDGFIITAFITSKPESFREGEKIWPRPT
ncbi:MAG: hypothetical protein ABEJ65_11630 [bacterium]